MHVWKEFYLGGKYFRHFHDFFKATHDFSHNIHSCNAHCIIYYLVCVFIIYYLLFIVCVYYYYYLLFIVCVFHFFWGGVAWAQGYKWDGGGYFGGFGPTQLA